jgi:hypothetical protein
VSTLEKKGCVATPCYERLWCFYFKLGKKGRGKGVDVFNFIFKLTK